MPGKPPKLTALQTRKQLLLLESDLNRVLLRAELGEIKKEIRGLTGKISSIGPLTALAVQIGTSLAGLFQGVFQRPPAADPGRSSRIGALLRRLRLGALLWSEFRSHWR